MPLLILSFFTSAIGRWVAAAVVVAGLLLGAYWKGYSTAAGQCHDAALRAQIATMQRDAAAVEDAAKSAADLQSQLASDNIALQQKVTSYEAELAAKPSAGCSLSDGDAIRLRGIGGR